MYIVKSHKKILTALFLAVTFIVAVIFQPDGAAVEVISITPVITVSAIRNIYPWPRSTFTLSWEVIESPVTLYEMKPGGTAYKRLGLVSSPVRLTRSGFGKWSYYIEVMNSGRIISRSKVVSVSVPAPVTPALYKLSRPMPIFRFRLKWSKNAGDYIYQLVEDTKPDFSTPDLPQYWPTGNFEYIPPREPGTYYYRVRAWTNLPESGGIASGWSNVITVNVISDQKFQDMIAKRIFNYFIATTSENGLTLDRFSTITGSCGVNSTAASGFYLSALTVGAKRGWIRWSDARERAMATLATFENVTPNVHGFFYHYLKPDGTPSDTPFREVSCIDTALFMAGALQTGEYFGGDVRRAAKRIYERIEWNWMYDTNCHFLYQAWTESGGLQGYYWVYSEATLAYLLAIGSPTHPIPPEAFYSFHRPKGGYTGPDFIFTYGGEAFTYQYPHAWFDFRDKTDEFGVNWFENSEEAAFASQRFSIDNPGCGYNEELWGLTACDGPSGYRAYGAKPSYSNYHDGTIAPAGVGGFAAITPDIALSSLKYIYVDYGNSAWKTYGFVDAFNPMSGWVDSEYIAIDQGITLLMLENRRSELIWQTFMNNVHVRSALTLTHFSGYSEPEGVTLEDFEVGGDGLTWWDIDGTVVYNRSDSKDPSHGGFNCMRVAYAKNNLPWSYFAGYIPASNPLRNFTPYTKLVVWVFGTADILVKLSDSSRQEAELGIGHATSSGGWTRLVFDYTSASSINLSDIENVLFFVAPGSATASGVIFLDDITFE